MCYDSSNSKIYYKWGVTVKQHDFWGCAVELDEVQTRVWYVQAAEWNCQCGDCRHFIALAKKQKLPPPILASLEELGIPPEKATYVCQIMPTDGGDLFQFSYRIVGSILEEKPIKKQAWGEVRCCHEPYPYGTPGFPEPHFDLEFWVKLPKNTEKE